MFQYASCPSWLSLHPSKKMNKLRSVVSKKKQRFQKEGFDLDLTYISDRVISMGFPSTGAESLYRNPLEEVKSFFQSKHDDHYKIYNLCSEKNYDPSVFSNRVARFPFDDHNAPHFSLILDFCEGTCLFGKLSTVDNFEKFRCFSLFDEWQE